MNTNPFETKTVFRQGTGMRFSPQMTIYLPHLFDKGAGHMAAPTPKRYSIVKEQTFLAIYEPQPNRKPALIEFP